EQPAHHRVDHPPAPPRPLVGDRGAHRVHHRVGDLPHAGRDRGTAAGALPDAARVDRGRDDRAVRRAHAGRGGRRAPRDRGALRVHPRGVGAAPGLSLRVGRARGDPRGVARRRGHHLRGVLLPRAGARHHRGAVQRLGALRGGGRDRDHRRVQLRGGAVGVAGAERHHAGQVRRARLHHPARLRTGAPAHGGQLHAGDAGRKPERRPVRARARERALGVRRVGRPQLRRGRGEGPAAQPAARSRVRHARRDRRLPRGEPRLPRRPLDRRDPRVAARGGGGGRAARRGAGGGVRRAHGDALHVRHAQRVAAHRAAHLLRDGRRPALLQAGGARAPALRDAVRGDRARGGARHPLRARAHLRAARRRLRDRDHPVLRPRGRLGVRAPPPAGLRPAVPGAGLPGGARPLRALDDLPAGQRAHRPREPVGDGRGARDDRGRDPGLLSHRRPARGGPGL
ncbi:MAG: Uncharacterized amino acid permease, GabP family, partial [uncultured Gemmatimonadaceae bacterium]